tara:strand:- start:1596 stop:1937 length:342 start_codon:yes stop_codon:yes gene_type:complete
MGRMNLSTRQNEKHVQKQTSQYSAHLQSVHPLSFSIQIVHEIHRELMILPQEHTRDEDKLANEGKRNNIPPTDTFFYGNTHKSGGPSSQLMKTAKSANLQQISILLLFSFFNA